MMASPTRKPQREALAKVKASSRAAVRPAPPWEERRQAHWASRPRVAPIHGVLQRKCACGTKPGGATCASCAGEKEDGLQSKLAIGSSNDPLEHEADRVADRVVAMSAPHAIGEAPVTTQRAAFVPSIAQHNDKSSAASRPAWLNAFPHGEMIGRRLGRPVTAQAVLDPAGCASQGAPAFTRDGLAHFSSSGPTLAVAAHEAVHVLQQRGAIRDQGLGAECHAAAVERNVVAGRDASALLGDRGERTGPGPHHYTPIDVASQSAKEWDVKVPLRVSDDGYMATQDTVLGSHYLWAHPTWVSASNATLAVANSGIRLEEQGSKISGSAPNGNGYRTLSRVLPKNLLNKTAGDTMALQTDCASAARTVMGVQKPADAFNVHGIYKTESKPADPKAKLTVRTAQTEEFNAQDMMPEILMKKFGLANPLEAVAKYQAMPTADRNRFDKETGLNKYAMPSTGEGYAIATAGKKIPGVRGWWGFHWAGVVMMSGSDRVTLENFANPTMSQNSDWVFQMYGSSKKAGQTFHEQQKATGHHRMDPVTMSVRHTQ